MKDRKVFVLVFVFIALSIVFSFVDFNNEHFDNTRIDIENVKMLNDEWQYKGRSIVLPYRVAAAPDSKVEISRILPQILSNNEYLCIISAEQSMEVYIDKTLIYRCGYDSDNNAVNIPGSIYNIIKLPKHAEGKKITVRYFSKYSRHSGEINQIFYGTKGDIILNVLRQGIYRLLIILCLVVVALVCFIILFAYRKSDKVKNFAYLGIYCIIVAVWVFLESVLAQFVFHNQHAVKIGAYFCVMIAPIPINLFLKNVINKKYYKSYRIFMYLYIINFIINFFLEVFMNSLLESTLISTHVIIFLDCIAVSYALIIGLYKNNNRHNQYIFICMAPILVAAVLEILKYYRKTFVFDTARDLIAGIALSMFFLVILTLIDFASIYRKAEYTKILNMLAFQDTITKGRNRTAFYRDIDMKPNDIKDSNVCVMVLDMNNLKHVNDKYGHIIGDKAIKLCYSCIENNILDLGTSYRIGGDEFTCIFKKCSEHDIEKFISRFNTNVESYNKKLQYEFNIAYGYAFYDKKIDTNLMDTFNRADKLMYSKKKSMKESLAGKSL